MLNLQVISSKILLDFEFIYLIGGKLLIFLKIYLL